MTDSLLSYRRDNEKIEVEEKFFYYLLKVIQSTLNRTQRIYSYMNLEPFFPTVESGWAPSLGASFLKFSKLK